MGSKLGTVLGNLCAYWGCPWHEVETNLFRLEIDEGTVAAHLFEGSGALHLALIAFEDDIVARYANWRSLTPGSYYLHRLLEYLRGLSTVGETILAPSFAAPRPSEVLRLTPQLSTTTAVLLRAIEIPIATLVFRFTIRLIGLDPTTEFISIPIETRHMKTVPEPTPNESPSNANPSTLALSIERAFECSLVRLRELVDRLVSEYAAVRKKATDRALRQIRSARDAELRQHASGRARRNANAMREELEELWREREEAILARSNVERVETALVAVTIQWRTMTCFQYCLHLAGGPREIEILFDRSSGWLEPVQCESCGQSKDVLEAAKTTCRHLICATCRSRLYDCGHSPCSHCDVLCVVCRQLCCTLCSVRCFDCGQCICKRHARSCFECSVTLCGRCSASCARCRRLGCETHSASCPVCTETFCAKHFQHDDSCYRTWVIERTAALLAFGEFNEPFCVNEWFAPFKLTGTDSFAIEEKVLSVFPEAEFVESTNSFPMCSVVVSIDDQLSWLVSEGLLADPVAQEYGLLPDEFSNENEILTIEPTDLRFGSFKQDLTVDPTRELVPLYDSAAPDDEYPPLAELLRPDLLLEHRELQGTISEVLRTLTPREEKLINLAFGLGGDQEQTPAEIAEDFQLSLKQVKEIEAKALRKLRHPARSRRLRRLINPPSFI